MIEVPLYPADVHAVTSSAFAGRILGARFALSLPAEECANLEIWAKLWIVDPSVLLLGR